MEFSVNCIIYILNILKDVFFDVLYTLDIVSYDYLCTEYYYYDYDTNYNYYVNYDYVR